MDNMKNTEKKKSTYNAVAQKKYNERNKIISCKVSVKKYEAVKTQSERKGFQSLNSYILHLIDADAEKTEK